MNHIIKKSSCLNCGNLLEGNFCKKCGQKANINRITFKETFKNFLSSSLSLEGPLLFTVYHLILNPGKIFREFIGGKRKTYYQPVPFYLLMTALYLILRALLDYDPLEGQIESVDQEKSTSQYRAKEAAKFMVDNISNIMFFLVFSIALNLKIFFKKHYNFAEYTSIGLFIVGLYTLFGILIMLINTFTSAVNNKLQLLIMVILIGYCSSSLFRRYNFWSIIKYIMVSLLSLILYMILGFGFSYLIVSF